ncbi:amidase family protein [Nevskia ramosa]|uniref:amidase family protein n=1 Tax=Nevskia ramosa TaxID=64002 RepID=UPI0003B5F1D7|nr:amidase family protein [Nevskia ramosa]
MRPRHPLSITSVCWLIVTAAITPAAAWAEFAVEEATIEQIHAAYLSGKTTAHEVTAAYLARIEAYDQQGPMLNAIITVNQQALAQADALDARLKATGKLSGPLHGIPFVAKDNIDTGDLPTSGGSASLADFQPQRDGTSIERIRKAGGILIAKASLAEFANGGFDSINSRSPGYVRNPYNTAYASGGSSGGTGVAMAANFAVVGLGTDTGISVRAPASINSVVGLRVSHGLVSLDGVMPLNVFWDTVGPMARTVRDTAALLEAIAGPDARDPISQKSKGHVPKSYTAGLKPGSLKGKRLGVLRQIVPADNSDPRVVALMDQAIADLRKAGAEIIDPFAIPELPELTKDWKGFTRLRDDFDGYLAKHPTAPYKSFKDIVASKKYLAPRFETAFTNQANYEYPADKDPTTPAKQQRSEEIRQLFLKAFDGAKLDAIIYPQFNFPPKKNGDTYTPLGRDQNMYSSITGFPALVVPMGFVDPGLPMGMQFFGRPWSEATLFEIGYGFEQATHHRVPPPTTPPLKDSFASTFIGTWKLVAIADRDPRTGVETPAERAAADGQLVYAANGRLSVQIVRTGREQLPAGTADGFSSYFGRWELLPAEGCMVHHQDGNLNQARIGEAAKRYYSFDARGHLSLATPPSKRADGKEASSVFIWERIPG